MKTVLSFDHLMRPVAALAGQPPTVVVVVVDPVVVVVDFRVVVLRGGTSTLWGNISHLLTNVSWCKTVPSAAFTVRITLIDLPVCLRT